MEFPHNHSYTHHHNRNDDEERQQPPPPYLHQHHHEFGAPPPPYYQQPGFDGPSPPPPAYFQQPAGGFTAPPQPYQPPPPSSHVTHVHHSGGSHQPEHSYDYSSPAPAYGTPHFPSESHHSSYTPHIPSSAVHHQSHTGPLSELFKKPSVKVFCKANPNLHLTIRDGKVVLAPSDPSDQFQHWYKDEKFSTSEKDEVGFPGFSLVNKATGQAIKHSIGASHPVQLLSYQRDHPDESILWSESLEVSDGYRAIRMINNIRLNVDAFHDGHKSVVHDGTIIGLWQWTKGDNQLWKIAPY